MTLITDGLIFAWRLDGDGGGQRLTANDLRSLSDPQAPLWVHLDRDKECTVAWLKHVASVPEDIRESLLVEGKRPMRAALDGSEFNGPVSSSTAPGHRGG